MAPYIIGSLFAVAALLPIVFVVRAWQRRWDVDRFGGILVRLEGVHLTPSLGFELKVANNVIREILLREFPSSPELADYRVIVRPKGGVGPRSDLGGTVAVERCTPINRRVFVAIVQAPSAGQFIAHEVARHIIPLRRHDDGDAMHARNEYAAIEQTMKVYIALQLQA